MKPKRLPRLRLLAAGLFVLAECAAGSARGAFPDVVAEVKRSVVAVGVVSPLRNPRFRFLGTGFVVGNGNQVVTNAHVLAAVPAIVLLTVPPLAHWKHFGKVAVFTWVVTAATSSMLAKADQWYASIYRDAPMLLAEKLAGKNGQTWFVGHWGWQWYAQKVGWRQWAPQSEQPQVGDHLIAPLQALGGDLPREVELALVGNYVLRPVNWVEHYASVGLYFNQYDLPWSYSTDLVEQFAVYRVAAIKDRVAPSGDKAP